MTCRLSSAVFSGTNVLRRTTAGVLDDYLDLTIANFQTERLTWCEDEFDTLEKITRKIRDVNRPPAGGRIVRRR